MKTLILLLVAILSSCGEDEINLAIETRTVVDKRSFIDIFESCVTEIDRDTITAREFSNCLIPAYNLSMPVNAKG
jgi:hypothetical protein